MHVEPTKHATSIHVAFHYLFIIQFPFPGDTHYDAAYIVGISYLLCMPHPSI